MPEDRSDKSIPDRVATWLTGQSFNNVLLVLILAAIAFGGFKGIPAVLQQIQDGYRELEASHSEERERIMKTYDRWLDRQQTGSKGLSLSTN